MSTENGEPNQAKNYTRDIAKNAAVVGGATLASRILGFLRDLIVAYTLGAGLPADAFFTAFRMPNLLRRLFGEGSLTMAFVPVFTRLRKEEGDGEAFAMARSTLVWLVLILGVITVLAMLFSETLTAVIAPGFRGNPELFRLTAELVRICFPYIILICSVALCMGVLNAMGHFLAPAAAPCVLNIVLICASLGAVAMEASVPHALAWGVLVAGVLQWMLQQPFLSKRGMSWRGPWSFTHPGVVRTGRLMLPSVFGAAVYQLNIVIGTLLASFLATGSISYLYYADRLVQFPQGIFAAAVSTAALPSLSAIAVGGNMEEFKDTLNAGLRLTMFISLPAAAGLMALAGPIISLLFQHGEFSADAAGATSAALVGYAAGLPAFGLVRSLVSAFYALEDTRTPVIIAAICLVLYVVTGVTLMQFTAHVGLAVAVSVASWANATMLIIMLRRKLGPWEQFVKGSAGAFALSLVVGFAAWLSLPLGLWAVALVPVWAGLYAVAAVLLRIDEATLMKGLAVSKLSRLRRKDRKA